MIKQQNIKLNIRMSDNNNFNKIMNIENNEKSSSKE